MLRGDEMLSLSLSSGVGQRVELQGWECPVQSPMFNLHEAVPRHLLFGRAFGTCSSWKWAREFSWKPRKGWFLWGPALCIVTGTVHLGQLSPCSSTPQTPSAPRLGVRTCRCLTAAPILCSVSGQAGGTGVGSLDLPSALTSPGCAAAQR